MLRQIDGLYLIIRSWSDLDSINSMEGNTSLHQQVPEAI